MIFTIYAKIILTKKPSWIEAFRQKYKNFYDWHVTLKQPCWVEKIQTADVKEKLSAIFQNSNPPRKIKLTFNRIIKDSGSGTIMLGAEDQDDLQNLRKKIVDSLKQYNDYCEPEFKTYEDNFIPHLTLAFDLKDLAYRNAMEDLQPDYQCKGIINEIVLLITHGMNFTEAKNPNNMTIFNLQ